MTSQSNFLDDLENYRAKHGVSITELANRLGFTRPYLNDILNKKRVPGRKFTDSVSSLLQTPVTSPSNGPALNLHPKIQAQAEEIMDREGFTTMDQLVTWFVKEEVARSGTQSEPAARRSLKDDDDESHLKPLDPPENN